MEVDKYRDKITNGKIMLSPNHQGGAKKRDTWVKNTWEKSIGGRGAKGHMGYDT